MSQLEKELTKIPTRVKRLFDWIDSRPQKLTQRIKDDVDINNWRQYIDAETLKMSNCRNCILGQLTGFWYNRSNYSNWDIAHGIYHPVGLQRSEALAYYVALTKGVRNRLETVPA